MIDALVSRHLWPPLCAKRLDVTDFDAQSDAMDFLWSKAEDNDLPEPEAMGIQAAARPMTQMLGWA
ncbi:MAG: hypothetical protein LBK42_11035 [Propionibacteriaceae bacterium]|nr:hypothetical protein [Propionibacteriaceae bacterium]